MRKYLLLLSSILILASCSTPKYTYYFDHYDYNSGKRKKQAEEAKTAVIKTNDSPASVSPAPLKEETLVASANEHELYVAKPAPSGSKEELAVKLKSLSKEEKRELKKEVKKYVREHKKDIKSGKSPQQLENDVKLAAIFGAVGIVLLIIGGDVLYILGAVALLIGLYFLIRWLVRQ